MSKGYLGASTVADKEVDRSLGNNDLASTEIAAVAGIVNTVGAIDDGVGPPSIYIQVNNK